MCEDIASARGKREAEKKEKNKRRSCVHGKVHLHLDVLLLLDYGYIESTKATNEPSTCSLSSFRLPEVQLHREIGRGEGEEKQEEEGEKKKKKPLLHVLAPDELLLICPMKSESR